MDSMDGPKFPKGTRLFFVNYEFLEKRENIYIEYGVQGVPP